MDKNKKQQLKKRGWKVISVAEFLNLSPEENSIVEKRLASRKHSRNQPPPTNSTSGKGYKEKSMSYATPIHPGEVLRDELEEIEISQSELAARIGVLPKTINEIYNGKRRISAVMAWKLSRSLGASPLFWMNLQNNWELSQVDESAFSELERIAA